MKIDANNAETKAKLDQILNKVGSISQLPIRLTNELLTNLDDKFLKIEISTEKIQNQQNAGPKG